jgi:hypothetical protein
MTAGDGVCGVPGKSPAVSPSLTCLDGTDGSGAVPSVLARIGTAHRPRPSDGTVDITAAADAQWRDTTVIEPNANVSFDMTEYLVVV